MANEIDALQKVDWSFKEYLHNHRLDVHSESRAIRFNVDLNEYVTINSVVVQQLADMGMIVTYPLTLVCHRLYISLTYSGFNCIIAALKFLVDILPVRTITGVNPTRGLLQQ